LWKQDPLRNPAGGYGSIASEVLAYELSQELGLDVVPGTAGYAYKEQNGSLQRFIPNAKTWGELGKGGDPVDIFNRLSPSIKILDTITGNRDRHGGNVLQDARGKIWAIDNGGAFGRVFGGDVMLRFAYESSLVRDYRPSSADRSIVSRLASWRGTPAYTRYIGRVRSAFDDTTAEFFEANVETIINWGL